MATKIDIPDAHISGWPVFSYASSVERGVMDKMSAGLKVSMMQTI